MKAAVASIVIASASGSVLSNEHIEAVPMHEFRQDCGTETRLHFKDDAPVFLQNVPGAGVDKFKAYRTVLKDGFLEVDCVKDYMYYRGDKFGDNKHDYKLGPVSNVSIVHYEDHVAKEDQVEMTQKVCFEFCRTVPNMGFFGIVNGRGCYCTPYFQAMESDSSQCDAVCEGEKTTMCGGKSKSSIFAMHMCASTKEDLGDRTGVAGGLEASLGTKVRNTKKASSDMQNTGDKLQEAFGQVGDSGATGLAQDAKVFSGTLVHKAEDGEKIVDKLRGLQKDANSLKGFTQPETVTRAERIMETIDTTVAQGEAVADELDELMALAQPQGAVAGAAKQYMPVMYFVDKEYQSMPTTCSGDRVGEPIVGLNADGCASACDANIHSCVGFQHFDVGPKLCFLFSKFKTGFYYTGCDKEDDVHAKCYAKLSKFEGTTLKPDGSGKCEQCFKELTKADRCYK